MLKHRIIGFVLLVSLLCGIFLWESGGVWLFIIAAPAMVGCSIRECCTMMNSAGKATLPMPSALAVWLMAVICSLGMMYPAMLYTAVILLALIIICSALSLLSMDEKLFGMLVNSAGVVLIFAPSLILFILTYFLPERGAWLFFLCVVTKATDTGGYIVGTLTSKLPCGNHKIAPSVSPKKSCEGLAGGILLSLAASCLFYLCAKNAELWWYIAAGVILSFGSFFGDLTESAVKRFCGIKDSGSFIPGMGGAFDVLDSFIYNGLIFWPLYLIKDISL